MDKLLKLEKYQLLHNSIYWCGMIGIFILGFFTADTYVTEVMGSTEEIASSLADIFNGMVYDSTFLLIIMSAILALILGQEFSKRTINLEVSAGHSRKQIFTSKIISYLIAFNLMALVYPVSGCIREFGRFGVADVGMFFYNIIKAIIYSCLLNSAIFLIAILIKERLGHEKIQTTLGTYGHLYPNTNLEVAKKLTGILQVQSATESIANYTSNQHTAIYHRTVEEK